MSFSKKGEMILDRRLEIPKRAPEKVNMWVNIKKYLRLI